MTVPHGLPLSQVPALEPPPGVIPNLVNPPSLANTVIVVSVVFLTLMLFFVSIRIYTKGVLLRSLGWEDCE